MTTAAVNGQAAIINIGGSIAEAFNWSMDRNTEAIEATSFDSAGNREFIAGLFGWGGSFTTRKFLNQSGAQAAATFQVGASVTAALPKFSGALIITNEPVAVAVDGAVEYAYTFQGTGVCTAATA